MGYKWKNNVIFSEGKELSEFLLDLNSATL